MSQAVVNDQHQVTSTPSKWPIVIVVAMVLASFGPYLAGGVRTDQPVTYGLAVLAVFALIMQRSFRFGSHAGTVLLWALLPIIALIGTLTVPAFRSGGEVAMLDNLLMPIAVSIVMAALITPENRTQLLRAFAITFVACMVVNSLLVLGQMGGGGLGSVSAWLPTGGGGAERVETTGRFMGIFHSPALSGVMYSIALIVAVWLLRRRPVLLTAVILLFIPAGFGAVSKVFIFGGLPVAALYLLYVSRRLGVWLIIGLGALSAIVYTYWEDLMFWALNQFPNWEGTDRIVEVIFGNFSVEGVTGNRYGEDSALQPVVDEVSTNGLLGGLGLSGTGSALDSAWIMSLVLGGVVGVVALALMILTAAGGLIARRNQMASDEFWMFAAVGAVLVGASFGAPVFTMNRLAVIVWMLIAFMLLGNSQVGDMRENSRPPTA